LSYTGGYYLIQTPFVTETLHRHTAGSPQFISQGAVDALNSVQATPRRVNQYILDVLQKANAAEDSLGGIIPGLALEPMPPKYDAETWAAMSEEQRTYHKRYRGDVHSMNGTALNKYAVIIRVLHVAQMMSKYERHWHPWNFDFRTRMYPMSQEFHPQGPDLVKSLLMFADGERIGLEGYRWLLFRLATTAGQDKLTRDDRITWAQDHLTRAFECVENPEENRWWLELEDPLQFLATAHELRLASELSDPFDFHSHLPVNIDGSQNGLQHLSLMARDPVGAVATNCAPGPRQDLYLEVLNRVKARVHEDVCTGHPLASKWAPALKRNHVKRACMTTSYGVTERGIQTQIMSDGFTEIFDVGDRLSAAKYLQECISEALEGTITKGKELMGYFQKCARAVSEQHMPFMWSNSIGSTLTQSYHNLSAGRVNTLCGKLRLFTAEEGLGINLRKSTLAASPNVVHSQDAAMCQMVINRLTSEGITDFDVIHDSYGVHACHASRLAHVTREVAYDMYKDNWLVTFHESVARNAVGVSLPDPPPLGDFGVSEVLKADFFFS